MVSLIDNASPSTPQPTFSHQNDRIEDTFVTAHENGHITVTLRDSDSSTSSRRIPPKYFPIWLRISRLIFGKIRRLPKSMSTTLVLFTVHMYLTVPVIIVCGATGDLKALLRPFRHIKAQGFLFEELGDQYVELF